MEDNKNEFIFALGLFIPLIILSLGWFLIKAFVVGYVTAKMCSYGI